MLFKCFEICVVVKHIWRTLAVSLQNYSIITEHVCPFPINTMSKLMELKKKLQFEYFIV